MATLLIAYTGPRWPLLTYSGPRPLLLDCPPELRRQPAASPDAVMPPAEPLRREPPRVDPDHVWQDEPPPPSARPRAPEKHIDPRTVFKRRHAVPTSSFGSRSGRAQPSHAGPEAAEAATHDFIVIPMNPAFRASDHGIKALVTYLQTAQILAAKSQKSDESGTTVTLLPDEFSHLAFLDGQAPSGPPSVLQGTLWFGPKALPLPFGDAQRQSAFRLELVGARFGALAEAFVARLHQILYLRPQVVVSAHDPARLRGPATKAVSPIPRFDLQER